MPEFLPEDAHRGAGVEFHVEVPDEALASIHQSHVTAGAAATELKLQPWGERAFHVRLADYQFLIASQPET